MLGAIDAAVSSTLLFLPTDAELSLTRSRRIRMSKGPAHNAALHHAGRDRATMSLDISFLSSFLFHCCTAVIPAGL